MITKLRVGNRAFSGWEWLAHGQGKCNCYILRKIGSSCSVIIANKFSSSFSSHSIQSIIFIRFLTSGKSSTHWSHKQTAGAWRRQSWPSRWTLWARRWPRRSRRSSALHARCVLLCPDISVFTGFTEVGLAHILSQGIIWLYNFIKFWPKSVIWLRSTSCLCRYKCMFKFSGQLLCRDNEPHSLGLISCPCSHLWNVAQLFHVDQCHMFHCELIRSIASCHVIEWSCLPLCPWCGGGVKWHRRVLWHCLVPQWLASFTAFVFILNLWFDAQHSLVYTSRFFTVIIAFLIMIFTPCGDRFAYYVIPFTIFMQIWKVMCCHQVLWISTRCLPTPWHPVLCFCVESPALGVVQVMAGTVLSRAPSWTLVAYGRLYQRNLPNLSP